MNASMNVKNELEEQSTFGIKKILDCNIGEGGKQMYKVKWEPTWEPAENLVGCQHLVDEFWSFVNKQKANEKFSQQHRKKMRLDISNNVITIDENFDRISEDNKAEIQELIGRTNATSTGNRIVSPSKMLKSPQQNNQMGMHSNNQTFFGLPQPGGQKHVNSIGQNVNTATPKIEDDDSRNPKKNITISSLKYLENFNNPYVKITVVCKICNKEQSLKFSGNWRHHYMTHSNEKPHKCQHCSKAFTHPCFLRNHMQAKHKDKVAPKQDHNTMNTHVKEENFRY